jgi:hypothetical protein
LVQLCTDAKQAACVRREWVVPFESGVRGATDARASARDRAFARYFAGAHAESSVLFEEALHDAAAQSDDSNLLHWAARAAARAGELDASVATQLARRALDHLEDDLDARRCAVTPENRAEHARVILSTCEERDLRWLARPPKGAAWAARAAAHFERARDLAAELAAQL